MRERTQRRFFRLDEADACIPKLEALWTRIMHVRSQLKVLYRQLEDGGYAPTAGDLAREETLPPGVRRTRAHFRSLIETLGEDLAAVEELGVMVKDIEIGLVDFWSQREGREVLLCWQYGEKAIGFWHTVDEGFAGRRPVAPSPRAGTRLLH